MKVRFPIMIQDQETIDRERLPSPVEGEDIVRDYFASGPKCKDVEILDYEDPSEPDKRTPPTKLDISKSGKMGHYVDAKGKRLRKYNGLDEPLEQADFMKVATLGLVLDTMDLLMSELILGRKINWAFGKGKLKVHTRGLDDANAYYQREYKSIYYGFFKKNKKSKEKIYACLSRDIVTHEVGHAIVDAICPQLSASHPESQAIHEALADMTAVLSALNNGDLLALTIVDDGSLHPDLGHFTYIAPEFAGKREGLRKLNAPWHINKKRKDDYLYISDYKKPHKLSMVLSSTLVEVIRKKQLINRDYELKTNPENQNIRQVGHISIRNTSYRITRIISRTLDWLPPGEVNFKMFYKAMIEVVKNTMEEPTHMIDLINDEFENRGLIQEYYSPVIFESPSPAEIKKLFATKNVTQAKQKLLLKLLEANNFEAAELKPKFETQLFIGKPDNGKRTRIEGVIKLGRITRMPLRTKGSLIPKYVNVWIGYSFIFDLDKKKLICILSNIADVTAKDNIRKRASYIKHLIRRGKIHLKAVQGKNPVIKSHIENDALYVENGCNLLHVK